MPLVITERLSKRAIEIAQIIGPRKTGRGLASLMPIYQQGVIGIEVPDQTSYMYDLDQGISVHAMVDLAGRVIPVRNSDGTISFRRASTNKIGTVPIISRAAKDGKLRRSTPEWVYPEKPGTDFLRKSLQMSVDEWKRTAKSKDVINLLMQTEFKNDINVILYGREAG